MAKIQKKKNIQICSLTSKPKGKTKTKQNKKKRRQPYNMSSWLTASEVLFFHFESFSQLPHLFFFRRKEMFVQSASIFLKVWKKTKENFMATFSTFQLPFNSPSTSFQQNQLASNVPVAFTRFALIVLVRVPVCFICLFCLTENKKKKESLIQVKDGKMTVRCPMCYEVSQLTGTCLLLSPFSISFLVLTISFRDQGNTFWFET